MKRLGAVLSLVTAAAVAVLLLLNGCSRATKDAKGTELTKAEAAELAASLANKECQRLHGRSPFSADSFSVRLEGSEWHWGDLDPVGVDGYSAEVWFDKDGSDPEVRVYCTADVVPEPETIPGNGPQFKKRPLRQPPNREKLP